MRMLRSSIAAVVLVLVGCVSGGPLAAQQQAVTLDNLRTPTSPAFVVLGVQPTSVERPTTPRAFALSLLSATGGEGGVVPENYAAEFAPYWMRSQPQLTFAEYFQASPLQSLRQTFSLSLATAAPTGADSTTGVGIGFRVSPLTGRASVRLDSLVTALDSVQDERLDLRVARRRAASAGEAGEVARVDSLLEVNAEKSRGLSRQIRENDERVGLQLQVAGALAAYYPQNDFSAGTVGRTGLWSTATYRWDDPQVDLIGLVRYQRDGAGDPQGLWDLGGRGAVTLNRLTASAEFVSRSASGGAGGAADGGAAFRSGNRLAGILEYRASDDLFVTFSFGQDHPREGSEGNPLIAILGGNLNFGSRPTVDYTRR